MNEPYTIDNLVRDVTSVENRAKSRVRELAERYTADILQQYEKDIKKLITNEIAQAHREGSPTSRLTSLYNKI